jgi:hypothetical protein
MLTTALAYQKGNTCFAYLELEPGIGCFKQFAKLLFVSLLRIQERAHNHVHVPQELLIPCIL